MNVYRASDCAIVLLRRLFHHGCIVVIVFSLLVVDPSSVVVVDAFRSHGNYISHRCSSSDINKNHPPLCHQQQQRLLWKNHRPTVLLDKSLHGASASLRQSASASDAAFATTMSSQSTTVAAKTTNEEEVAIAATANSSMKGIPLWKLAVAGGIATLVSDVSMHPIDCIKTYQQSDVGFAATFWEAADTIYRMSPGGGGSICGFYHGLWTYALTDAVGGGIKFATFERCQSFLRRLSFCCRLPQTTKTTSCHEKEEEETNNNNILSAGIVLASAATAFCTSSVVTVPGEFLKQQLQMSYYENLWQALQGTYQTHGLRGFYSGYDGLLLRDIPYTMLELGLYTFIQQMLLEQQQQRNKQQQKEHKKKNNNNNNLTITMDDDNNDNGRTTTTTIATTATMQQQVIAAAVTGGLAGFLTTPLDTIKTKLMVDDAMRGVGFCDCFLSTVHHHGWEALFAGGMARVAWLVPLTVLYLPTYDFLKRRLGRS